MQPNDEERRARLVTRLVDAVLLAPTGERNEAPGESGERVRQVTAQRRVAQTLRAGGPAVPPALLSSIETQVHEAYGHGRPTRRARGRPTRRLALTVPTLAAVCVAIAMIVLGTGGSDDTPSLGAAARLALASATGPAPTVRSARLLNVSYQGVTYPSYAALDVPATGVRSDRVGGRPAFTVFYKLRSGVRMSYTVFSGRPVALPRSARTVVFDGVRLKTFSVRPGLSVVTLVRSDRTCVLAAPTVRDVLLALAAAPVRAQQVT